MKRIVTIVLAAIMMLSCMTGVAFAAEPGETVTIAFTTVNNPGFANYNAAIKYDANALELKEIAVGELCSKGMFEPNVAVAEVGFMQTTDVTGDGVLFTATFEVKADAAPGTYEVSCVLDAAATTNANNEPVSFIVTGGKVEVEAAQCEHQWGEWEVVTPATCTEAGEEKRECAICGEVETRVIAATGHDHDGEWAYDDDNHWHECKCGDIADKAPHDTEWIVTKNPTHNEAGLKHEECKVCEWRGEDVEIPADPNLDDVPGTGDMTPVVAAAFVAVLCMAAVVVFVFKRKLAI